MYHSSIHSSIPEFISETEQKLQFISSADWSSKPSPDKWSKKEILGHLIDSAQNNIRRLIVSQYQENDKIIYQQNEWVKYSDYQQMDIQDLILYWRLSNEQYHRITERIPISSLSNTCDTGSTQPSLVTLEFLIQDYWGHQQHHLRQILGY